MIDVLETIGAAVRGLPDRPGRMPISRRLAACLSRLRDVIALWRQRSHTRQDFRKTDDRMREDIGVTQADVWREAGKWFWQK